MEYPLPPDHPAWQRIDDLFAEIDRQGKSITTLTHETLREMRTCWNSDEFGRLPFSPAPEIDTRFPDVD